MIFKGFGTGAGGITILLDGSTAGDTFLLNTFFIPVPILLSKDGYNSYTAFLSRDLGYIYISKISY